MRSEIARASLARGSDGSESFRYEGAVNYLGAVERPRDQHWFVTPGRGNVTLDVVDRTARVFLRAGTWAPLPAQSYEARCEETSKRFGYHEQLQRVEHREAHGFRVVAYGETGSWFRSTAAFAPDLACLPLSASFIDRNRWGVPVEINSWEVTRIQLGEPDRRLFEIPAGYRVVRE
jgi:hypothetical protein